MNQTSKILLVDFCNYDDFPMGGYLTNARNILESMNSEIALVGISTNPSEPVGKWFSKQIDGVTHDYFALAHYTKAKTRHFIPDRLVAYVLLKFYKKKILSFKTPNIFIQRQEILQAVHNFGYENICYCFAGLENPLSISKYKYARFLAGRFEKRFFKNLKEVDTILAAGNDEAINEMVIRSKGAIELEKVHKFPTRINTSIFKPRDKYQMRTRNGIPLSSTIVVTTGRLAEIKGWKFMIDCFEKFSIKVPDSYFYMLGEGEDRMSILNYSAEKGLNNKIILTGKKNAPHIAEFLASADLFLMGSYKEGWSTSLIEAIACGVPSCVTDFSSAHEIIDEGVTGYVIKNHNVDDFVEGMNKALAIPLPIKNEKIQAFATNRLRNDLLSYWHLT